MNPKETTLSHDDFLKFIDAIGLIAPFHQVHRKSLMSVESVKLFFRLMFYCALGQKDVQKLKKENFDLEKHILKIKRESKEIETTIPPIIWGDIKDYLKDKSDEKYLFTSNLTKKPITRQTAWTYAKEAGKKAGLNIFQVTKKREIEGISSSLFKESYRQFMLNNKASTGLVELKLRSFTRNRYGGYGLHDLKVFERGIFKTRLSTEEIQDNMIWYKSNYLIFESLSKEIHRILSQILKQRKIKVQDITPRAKEPESFRKKLEDGISYDDPKRMQDLAGIRVVCFAKSDVDGVCQAIEEIFDIINKKGGKEEIEKINPSGYSDIQYVSKLPKSRISSSEELKQFENKYFEIQVRTVLQHAWAEIEHDDLYKNTSYIPQDLRRRFFLVSNVLESADNELNELHQKIKNLQSPKT